uniref:Uncharacterized protein n=1 Tax=Setaria digitata TaxID=48799 RepID=A0A915PZN2_9BILA
MLLLTLLSTVLCDTLPVTVAVPPDTLLQLSSSPPPAPYHSIRSVDSAINATSAIILNDLLCNDDSEFVCVCQHNAGNLLKHYVLCNQLIESAECHKKKISPFSSISSELFERLRHRRNSAVENRRVDVRLNELPVIEMNIRRINLSARLHTNETYESYFKRRVAAIVSNYCEQQADECMATTLRLKKENVVLLSIKPNNLQSTVIGFVITKSQRRSTLSPTTILDSTKVKYVLSAQLAALSRVLGGVRIEQVETAIMTKYRDGNSAEATQQDNLGLLIILSVVATFLTITYAVAAVRVCRGCYAKRQAKKNTSKLNKASEKRNYGTCTGPYQNEVCMNYETRNIIKNQENNPTNSSSQGTGVMDIYQMRRMFQCDPSQLPAEESSILPQSSNDFLIIYASKSVRGVKSEICDPISENVVHQLQKTEIKKENFAFSQENNEASKENKTTIEVPQKYNKISARKAKTASQSPNYESRSISFFLQPEYEFFKQQVKLPAFSWNQAMTEESLQAIKKQLEPTSDLIDSNLNGSTTNEQFESTWNQSTIGDESAWLLNKTPTGKPHTLTSSFPELLFNPSNHYREEIITSELHPENQKNGSRVITGRTDWERITDQPRHLQRQESSSFFPGEVRPTPDIGFIQKSRAIHQLDDWSSESGTDDDEGDVYHKLSEAEEDIETTRSLESATTSRTEEYKNLPKREGPKIHRNENNNFGVHSSTYATQ